MEASVACGVLELCPVVEGEVKVVFEDELAGNHLTKPTPSVKAHTLTSKEKIRSTYLVVTVLSMNARLFWGRWKVGVGHMYGK